MKMMTRPGDVQYIGAAAGARPDQEGVRRERNQVRLPDRAGRRRNVSGFGDAANAAVAQKGLELVKPTLVR